LVRLRTIKKRERLGIRREWGICDKGGTAGSRAVGRKQKDLVAGVSLESCITKGVLYTGGNLTIEIASRPISKKWEKEESGREGKDTTKIFPDHFLLGTYGDSRVAQEKTALEHGRRLREEGTYRNEPLIIPLGFCFARKRQRRKGSEPVPT